MSFFSSLSFFLLTFFHILAVSCYGYQGDWTKERPPFFSFDPGPDLKTQKDIINLHSEIPYAPGISLEIMRHRFKERKGAWRSTPSQKFRPAYGPIPWRMILRPNNVKILFIGQDGTHVAEAAGRPATAGFGGRAQSLAAFFGVEYSAAFINTYAFTIKGQYAARMAPYVHNGRVKTHTIVPNDVWLMSQDQSGPVTRWRNDLIEWIINNNRKSLKLIVLFGGAAKDSIASFIESRGGHVSSRWEHRMNQVQVPEFFLVNSGGNGEFPVPFNQLGGDVYKSLLGKKLNYKGSGQKEALSYVKENNEKTIEAMVFSHAGPYGNGLLHHAQLGGYDLDKIWVEREKKRSVLPTRSLRGLTLEKGGPIEDDILVVSLPHPTYLSHRMNDGAIGYWEKALKGNKTYEALKAKKGNIPSYQKLGFMGKVLDALPDRDYAIKLRAEGYARGKKHVADLVERDLVKIRPYERRGWFIPADPSSKHYKNKNTFAMGGKYQYGRSEISSVYYDFGTPQNRMVSRSSARRGSHRQKGKGKKGSLSRGPQIIIFGTRDIPQYDKGLMDEWLSQLPNQELDPGEMFVSRPRFLKTRYQFDPGPQNKYAGLMKSLPYEELYRPKEGMKFSSDGIDTYLIKTHPRVGDFGHYRGTFHSPRVFILADPEGVDGLVTSRALTGTRGQYLHGLMENMGIGDQYLLLKTVPFGMDEAPHEDWKEVYKLTRSWRRKLVSAILEESGPELLIISDGPWAKKAMLEILGGEFREEFIGRYFSIARRGRRNNFGITQAARSMGYPRAKGEMSNIPRTHLPYYSRLWEGTSGDRVMGSQDITKRDKKGQVKEVVRYKGQAFLVVVPNWVVERKIVLSDRSKKAIEVVKARLQKGGFPMPNEPIPVFLERRTRKQQNRDVRLRSGGAF